MIQSVDFTFNVYKPKWWHQFSKDTWIIFTTKVECMFEGMIEDSKDNVSFKSMIYIYIFPFVFFLLVCLGVYNFIFVFYFWLKTEDKEWREL